MGNSIDRLSDLPDPILTHILSFLSTKDTVRTCILSKRWKTLWASVPVLTFDFKEFLPKDMKKFGDDKFLPKDKLLLRKIIYYEAMFVQFIQGVLQNREALPVGKFQIHWVTGLNTTDTSKFVEKCILPALKFKPRVLHAIFPKPVLRTFNSDPIFTCTSLQDLHWLFPFKGTIPNVVNLPSLRKLHLESVKFTDGCLSKLFIGCRMLVELFLSDCYLNTSTICSDQLRELVFHDCCVKEKIQISAPNLFHLKFLVRRVFGISIQNMSDPMNASFHPSKLWHYDKVPAKQPMLLDDLSNATSLKLFVFYAQIIGTKLHMKKLFQNDICPDLSNLKGLTLRTQFAPKETDWLAFLLNHSPKLKKLTLCAKRRIFSYNYGSQWDVAIKEVWSQEEPKAVSFQREYLETIEIIRFSENHSVNWLVNYLHAHVKSIGEIKVI